ncbi:3-deoxy-D-manno-octulosonic acid transferase [Helicobacter saguini]|uniref:3-deoxy-D-manno-octulosonic acid transferase n=1 Tax=Helicobacter saguini TaxID=1548018 RepID=A0A347VS72_9HELI|nr:glycosyltransferase N-terminal domain-containing protein [Helicobacter saguini]MWV62627.1 3-deoxy-D-manno-octulosonic acid transferase [Helicobacter saguini]MWV66701.1 3-deoxy-D-manno-octulosonic acid transferase [Helicobacter saguini]MWV69051.1 3-deoxy-D-manno-octulosonic acid transferase [Helicobacter saguini]MWV71395.1 3-deoxy-D-manno-octulosonic acid transferase [Helicobacter saguini]TLD94025.1 3-deoxy-D-manno-octulosonic acid transferase [Helicobacter saguini]
MIYIYYFLICFLHILALPVLIFLTFKEKYKESIPLRFFKPTNFKDKKFHIWIHVCSFGEVNSLQKILDSITFDKNIFLSVITHTGFSQAKKLYGSRKNVTISYLAFESLLPFVAPKCEKLFVFEAELWLMLFYLAKKNGAKTKLINARISTRSFPRYRKLKFFYSYLFSFIDSILAQSEIDKIRLESLNAKNVKIIGNIKALNDINVTKCYIKPERLVILAASTHADKPLSEEEQILKELEKLQLFWDKVIESKLQDSNIDSKEFIESKLHNFAPTSHINKDLKQAKNALFIVVPRHPERFLSVYNTCKKYFSTIKFSEILDSKKLQNSQQFKEKIIESNLQNQDSKLQNSQLNTQKVIESNPIDLNKITQKVLIIDTLGELINFYAISDIVILGGGFASVGGHNPLEPAAFHNILLSGKEIFNQNALFSCVQNYYIIESSEIFEILKNYNALYTAQIALDSKEILNEILE